MNDFIFMNGGDSSRVGLHRGRGLVGWDGGSGQRTGCRDTQKVKINIGRFSFLVCSTFPKLVCSVQQTRGGVSTFKCSVLADKRKTNKNT